MIEKLILSNLTLNEEYARRILPFLKEDYFSGADLAVFKLIETHYSTYNTPPTKTTLNIDASKLEDLNETVFKQVTSTIDDLSIDGSTIDWLIDTTETFCQDKAIYNAIIKSINISDGTDKKYTKEAIPQILSDALAVSFEQSIGHWYLEDWEKRYEYYHRVESRIAFDLSVFNEITRGGLPPKTLNVILAGTGVGKSQFMCHMAANNLLQGKNVLYITAEMAEEEISMRVDANLLDVDMAEIENLSRQQYERLIQRLRSKTAGKLVVKEYPTAVASAAHFRHLLNELRLKKNFVPDIIYVDYLNICSSSRLKAGKVSSYEYVKAIAEELRGLAIEFVVPIVTATQLNRTGFESSDPELTDTSESFGLPATADFMFALVQNEQLAEAGRIMVKQLKNRYNSPDKKKRFIIGVDRGYMRFYEVEEEDFGSSSRQIDDKPLFDRSKGVKLLGAPNYSGGSLED